MGITVFEQNGSTSSNLIRITSLFIIFFKYKKEFFFQNYELRIQSVGNKQYGAYSLPILQNVIEQGTKYKNYKLMNSFKQIKTAQSNVGPCPRWGHAMCALNHEIILFGGYQNSKYYKDLWKFDLQTLEWNQLDQYGQIPPPCSNFTMNLNADETKMIIFGGGTLNKEKMNWAYELNLSTYEWKRMQYVEGEQIPWQRSYHCSEIFGKFLVVFGGEFFHDFDDLWLFNMQTGSWTEVKFEKDVTKPNARKFASSFKHENKMYIVGGCENKYECLPDAFYIDFQEFLETEDSSCLKWNELVLSDTQLIKRWGHASVVKDGKAYIFGGRCGNKDLPNLVQIDLLTGKCVESLLKNSVKGRRKPGFCMKNNTLFLFSGFDGSYINDFSYINLMAKPTEHYEELEQETCLKNLKQEFIYYQPEELDYKFENNVINLELFEFQTCLEHIYSNIKRPFRIQGFPGEVCAKPFAKKSKYFEYLFKNSDQEVIIYRPENLKNVDFDILRNTFVLYMQFGKIIMREQSFDQQQELISQLIQLADYYCIDHLKNISQEYMLELYEQKVRTKKTSIKTVLSSAYNMYLMEPRYGEYTCYFALTTLISKLSLDNINQLYILSQNWLTPEERQWINTFITKHSFELKEMILNKQKIEDENTMPEKIEALNYHKIQDTTNTGSNRRTKKGSGQII